MTQTLSASIDAHVALRLRRKRLERGFSQAHVATYLTITVSELESYEAGANRVSPENMLRLCDLFQVVPSYFFKAY
jgi:transcriptional regulator with XRE-family HTH domain